MKITKVEALILRPGDIENIADSTQDAALIRIETDEGIVGFGEADASPSVVKAIVESPRSHMLSTGLREVLIGEDPFRIQYLWDRMYQASTFYGRRGAVLMAMSGIDIALYDLVGKALGVPAHQLLGGARHYQVRAYASTLMPDTPEEAREEASRLVDEGFTAIKFGWGPFGLDLDRDVELVAAVRDEVGDGIDILLDIGFTWKNHIIAARQIDRIAEYNPYLIEEPLPPDDLVSYAKLREISQVPIAFGEENTTRHEFVEIFERRAADIVQPDVTRCGGLTEMARIAALAEHYAVPCIPHAWSTGIVQAASLHVNAILKEPVFLEYSVRTNPLNQELVVDGVDVAGGMAQVPMGPGLGIEIDEDAIQRMTVQV
ncbi:MAG: mandelate racemase/muconate lactonizing enzyme family protein [Acidimicrobiia bacterium]|nr:mandelate racemase/muconate lactonizing enzyme family protein [Acidimicrobiia bacterium]